MSTPKGAIPRERERESEDAETFGKTEAIEKEMHFFTVGNGGEKGVFLDDARENGRTVDTFYMQNVSPTL